MNTKLRLIQGGPEGDGENVTVVGLPDHLVIDHVPADEDWPHPVVGLWGLYEDGRQSDVFICGVSVDPEGPEEIRENDLAIEIMVKLVELYNANQAQK